jgi:hypothetical protein
MASTRNLEEVLSHFSAKKSSPPKNPTQPPGSSQSQADDDTSRKSSSESKSQNSIADHENSSVKSLIPISSYSSSDEENTTDENKCIISNGNPIKNNEEFYQEDFYKNSKNINDIDDDEDDFSNEDDNDSENFYDAIDSNQSLDVHPNQMTGLVALNTSSSTTLTSTENVTINPRKNSLKIQVDECHQEVNSTYFESSSTSNANLKAQVLKFDLDYDEDILDEDIDLDNQSSVITHLLTQVRIGMDLTKITLPTFILEPRSLLEMYADFFAHTDLFLEIPDTKSPRDRMIKVVKWYLSTFHAGRKSPVAKKPYNPILGELFQCWYSIPNASTEDKNLVTDGPVPWANRDQLTFIAEQVSHHPPISAFYAEHYNKRVQLDGYTWTKSKFLGLSIGVHMIGKAVLSLLDHGEEYIFSFPSAYGRSILTVPWFEMGGQVQINCPKSGFNTTIDFLTKPFYGGKKHQISGQIIGPDKKQLYTLDGDWNGTMFIKSGKSQDILISTQSTPAIKKQVRPVYEQSEYESRRLWQECTYFLRNKKIDQATYAKQKLEKMQRDDAKSRKDKNLKWNTKYFHEQGEHWIYVKPLINRLNSNL